MFVRARARVCVAVFYVCAAARAPSAPTARRRKRDTQRRGAAAHRRVSAVSAESDAGTVPPIALLYKALRSPPPHGRRADVAHRTRGRGGRGTAAARLCIAARRRGYKSG